MAIRKNILSIAVSVGLCALMLLPLESSAREWNLQGIDFITREERGASEDWKYIESGRFNGILENNKRYMEWLDGEGLASPGFEARKIRQEKNQIRTEFLEENYPDHIGHDHLIDDEGEDKTLLRKHQIRNQKNKLIIHHTADNLNIQSHEDAKEAVRYFYKLHTLDKGWGDIGYNFLIDKYGNIYEGKSGGEGVIGAHASWNNASSVGVALIGNYEHAQPSKPMIDALVDILVSLSYKYEIRPVDQVEYFKVIDEFPFLEVDFHDAVAGHKDAGNTACPGEHVYEKIPDIKSAVMRRMQWLAENGKRTLDAKTIQTHSRPFVLSGERGVIRLDNPSGVATEVSCRPLTEGLLIENCTVVDDRVMVTVLNDESYGSGRYSVGVGAGRDSSIHNVGIIREDQIDRYKDKARTTWLRNNSLADSSPKKKSVSPISIGEAKNRTDRNIDVLLYEPTAEYDSRNILCESAGSGDGNGNGNGNGTGSSPGECVAMAGGQRLPESNDITVMRNADNPDTIRVFANGEQYQVPAFGIQAKEGSVLRIANYDRATGGYPLNLFKGTLTITKQPRKHIDGSDNEGFVVMNTVPFDDYLLGIGEASMKQHEEKIKTLAILAKQYALWYLAGDSVHPSVLPGAHYQAIDDARFFQRYVGAGREAFADKWTDAVDATKNVLVSYNGMLPILPYFHCSGGFTFSGQEKRGWTDTPWLQSVSDPKPCLEGEFQGHGVGLSGDGSEAMAQAGADYKEILQWFYPGVRIVQ